MLRLTLPTLLTIAATVFFLALERLRPGRQLPAVKGWYGRALVINLVQMACTLTLLRFRDVYDRPEMSGEGAGN